MADWTPTGYVLEVCEFLHFDDVITKNMNSTINHVGYMKGKFKTKEDAASYYDRHNPHMRSLCGCGGAYRSDWDPKTRLLYIVRDDYLINATIDCFSIEDNSEMNNTTNGGTMRFKWLK